MNYGIQLEGVLPNKLEISWKVYAVKTKKKKEKELLLKYEG